MNTITNVYDLKKMLSSGANIIVCTPTKDLAKYLINFAQNICMSNYGQRDAQVVCDNISRAKNNRWSFRFEQGRLDGYNREWDFYRTVPNSVWNTYESFILNYTSQSNKYLIGDIVKLKSDLKTFNLYDGTGFIAPMKPYCGAITHITDWRCSSMGKVLQYNIDADNGTWFWTGKMFADGGFASRLTIPYSEDALVSEVVSFEYDN